MSSILFIAGASGQKRKSNLIKCSNFLSSSAQEGLKLNI